MKQSVYCAIVCHTFETENLKIANLTGFNRGGIIRNHTICILSKCNILQRKTVDREIMMTQFFSGNKIDTIMENSRCFFSLNTSQEILTKTFQTQTS